MSALHHFTRSLCALALILATVAGGEARAECQKPYTDRELMGDMSTMTVALRDGNQPVLSSAAQRAEGGLACIRTKVPPQVFANAYRFIGASQYLRGQESAARAWFRSALELAPTYEWDVAEVPLEHPMRRVFEEERANATVDPVPVDGGRTLNVPAGSSFYLDGRKLTRAEATPSRPHLLQVVADSDGSVRQSFIIQGNAIPEQYLSSPDQAAVVVTTPDDKKQPKGAHQPNYDLQAVKVQRVRPAAKTPLMLTGGAIVLGSAGLYATTFATKAKFDAATTSTDLERYQQLTNTLVIASGATLLVGLGVEYAGVMLGAGGPGIQLRGDF